MEDGQVIDEGLAVYFSGPRSFTGEDVLELHVHSGKAIIASIMRVLSQIPGCRMAERGEFTRRAFDAGRMDLTQVEGLRDLIDAETEEQRKWALGATQGAIREEVEAIRKEIVTCLMLCEAEIDFGDTEDIDTGVVKQAHDRAVVLRDKLKLYLSDSRKGEIMRNGVRIVLFGEPNAGKSSLLNWLAQRQAAIVTPVPGTTRDILEVALDIDGLPVIACDTAGIRKTEDLVERIGVQRAGDAVRQADIAICVVSLPELEARNKLATQRWNHRGSAIGGIEAWPPPELGELMSSQTLVLLNKLDVANESAARHAEYLQVPGMAEDEAGARRGEEIRCWRASVTTGEGMQEFINGLVRCIRDRYQLSGSQGPGGGIQIGHARQRLHMENAVMYLEAFIQGLNTHGHSTVVLAAEELRYAAREIGAISRQVTVDDILDAVFREFCIGK